jgi:alkanesulfonate monooxygenase SsuD/methylene tetrahydromethanopterin reductase-like flavin-dependent oxidoreductase (luciferase family)
MTALRNQMTPLLEFAMSAPTSRERADRARSPTGTTVFQHERIHAITRIAVHAEQAGFDVLAIGEHHNPPLISSDHSTLLAYVAAKTSRIILSTSTTPITTNDPMKIAEDFATVQPWLTGESDAARLASHTPHQSFDD